MDYINSVVGSNGNQENSQGQVPWTGQQQDPQQWQGSQGQAPWIGQWQDPQWQPNANNRQQEDQRSEHGSLRSERDPGLHQEVAELRRLLQNQQNQATGGGAVRVAKTKHVELPAYKGERAMYVSWKENINAYLDVSGIPEQFRDILFMTV